MKKIVIALAIMVAIMVMVVNWLENGRKTVTAEPTPIPVVHATDAERAQVAVSLVANVPVTTSAAPVVGQAQVADAMATASTIEVSTDPRLATLPRKFWPLMPQIRKFYEVFDVWVPWLMLIADIPGLNPNVSSEETFEEFQKRAQKESEASDAAEPFMAIAGQKISAARDELEKEIEQALNPESVREFADWSATNWMSRLSKEDLARLRTKPKLPDFLSGYAVQFDFATDAK